MKRKNVLIVILTALIFLSAVALGISGVYRISEVTVYASVVSKEAEEEAAQLKERLTEAYQKKSLLFANESVAEEIFKDFPYFQLKSFEKAPPNRIVVTTTEDAEVYAVKKSDQNAYYILSADGTVLGIRENPDNRLDDKPNVLLEGLTAQGEIGQKLSGDAAVLPLLATCEMMSQLLDGLRGNLVSATVMFRSPKMILSFQMKEGVTLYLESPEKLASEKTQSAIDKYLSLSIAEKTHGGIYVSEANGELLVYYSES